VSQKGKGIYKFGPYVKQRFFFDAMIQRRVYCLMLFLIQTYIYKKGRGINLGKVKTSELAKPFSQGLGFRV
jgi:hypothetical protein